MRGTEMWFWLGVTIVAGLTISSMFRSIFYYRHEAKRQIELAKAGIDPTTNNGREESQTNEN